MQALWFWLASIMVALYAVLDGFDFGAGLLHPFVARTDRERREVLAAIGPHWDGNEVWLLAAGGSLLLAFPKVLTAGFSGLYLAMFLVLWTLLLRGIAIEFRSHVGVDLWRSFWDGIFFLASGLMPILLGAALGNVLRGVPLDAEGQFHLPLFTDFVPHNPVGILDYYTVLVGLFVFLTLAAHGALFLSYKTERAVRDRCRKLVLPLWGAVLLLGIVVTWLTARVNPALLANLPKAPLGWVGTAIFAVGLCLVFWGQPRGRDLTAFLGSSLFILGLLAATAACAFPVMLRSTLAPEFNLTAHNASASQQGLVAGAKWWFLGFPLVVAYFVIVFRLHRGKVRISEDGHGY